MLWTPHPPQALTHGLHTPTNVTASNPSDFPRTVSKFTADGSLGIPAPIQFSVAFFQFREGRRVLRTSRWPEDGFGGSVQVVLP